MLSKFQKYVNILPIIAKADSFTSTELYKMKMSIINEAEQRNVEFLDCYEAIESLLKEKKDQILRDLLNLNDNHKNKYSTH